MNLNELDEFNLGDAVHFHDTLNPSLFETDSDMLRPAVRKRLLTIAEDFIDHLGVNVKVEDITLSGSSAAYSYTKHSDIDLHILVDMSKLPDNEVYLELFNAKKTIYNDTHNITIFGYDVELYVQDSNEPVVSLGEYSVKKDKWIKLPRKRRANFDQAASQLKYNKLGHLIERALHTKDIKKLEDLIKKLKKYRKAGLDAHGEFGPENLAYKALRTQGMIQKIYDTIDELHSKQLSLPENKLLDKPEMTVTQLAHTHKVSKQHIQDQLSKGIKVEMEHTSKYDVAKEIALDHLAEDPNYYTKLDKAELEEASDPTPQDLKDVAGWMDTTPDKISIEVKQEPIEKFIKQIREMYGTYDEFPEDEERTNRILKLLKRGSKPLPVYVEAGDPDLFVMEGRHRMVAFWLAGMKSIPVAYASKKQEFSEASGYIPSKKEKNDPRFKTALTVDVHPDSIKKNAKAFGFKVSRAGIPPLLRK